MKFLKHKWGKTRTDMYNMIVGHIHRVKLTEFNNAVTTASRLKHAGCGIWRVFKFPTFIQITRVK